MRRTHGSSATFARISSPRSLKTGLNETLLRENVGPGARLVASASEWSAIRQTHF